MGGWRIGRASGVGSNNNFMGWLRESERRPCAQGEKLERREKPVPDGSAQWVDAVEGPPAMIDGCCGESRRSDGSKGATELCLCLSCSCASGELPRRRLLRASFTRAGGAPALVFTNETVACTSRLLPGLVQAVGRERWLPLPGRNGMPAQPPPTNHGAPVPCNCSTGALCVCACADVSRRTSLGACLSPEPGADGTADESVVRRQPGTPFTLIIVPPRPRRHVFVVVSSGPSAAGAGGEC